MGSRPTVARTRVPQEKTRIVAGMYVTHSAQLQRIKSLEMPGIEPGASHMQSERSTTELHPQINSQICP